ncbi:hypothetical protein E4U42_001018 [Claviceps africana]|uniref:Protein kinase domain-containing protein n=1 Tax=Claviceps africana TaxID=83212 RepID=A0A8K0NEJ2_9HYPO|nr:hypothetical protein E4U42_001018 [Claviceps africana]
MRPNQDGDDDGDDIWTDGMGWDGAPPWEACRVAAVWLLYGRMNGMLSPKPSQRASKQLTGTQLVGAGTRRQRLSSLASRVSTSTSTSTSAPSPAGSPRTRSLALASYAPTLRANVAMAENAAESLAGLRIASLASPRLTIDRVDDPQDPQDPPERSRPPLASAVTEPPGLGSYSSPARQHRRTPSETLDARVEFSNDEADGRTYHRINQYVIVEEIGRGSYGAVHRATDQFGNEFAVKEFSKARLRKKAQSHFLRLGPRGTPRQGLPRPGRAPGGPLPPQFTGLQAGEQKDALFFIREEIAIMKKLNHPNLVQLIEVLDDPEEDSLYMVMEMCKKGVIMSVGLDKSAEPYHDESCRCWFRDLLLGIEYLHAQGVIHRDIKPDNLLLSDDDVLKIVDFGVSEMFDKSDSMRVSKSAGSPAFMPPELCGKHQHVSGTAADIWSMGVTLYCLKYGKIPFNRSGVLEIYEAIKLDDAFVPEGEDADFVDLMSRILEKDPEKRITMPELREHPWVTRRGADPLLSREDNCENMIEPPNELELNRAFTRKMNHLLSMMKVIHKFKMLLAKTRNKQGTSPERLEPVPASPRAATPEGATLGATAERAGEDEIERILASRRRLLTQRDESADKGHAHEVAEQGRFFLGIGAGARDAFAQDEGAHESTANIVADSPGAVDYNVYDRAYDEAIRRRMEAKPSKRPTMYLTRFVKEAEYFKKMENLAETTVLAPPVFKTEAEDAVQTLKDNPSTSGSVGSLSASQD